MKQRFSVESEEVKMDYEKAWQDLEWWIEDSSKYLATRDESKYQTIMAVKETMEAYKRLYSKS